MKNLLSDLLKSTSGSATAEYSLAVAAVGAGTIAALTALGDEIKAVFEVMAAALGG